MFQIRRAVVASGNLVSSQLSSCYSFVLSKEGKTCCLLRTLAGLLSLPWSESRDSSASSAAVLLNIGMTRGLCNLKFHCFILSQFGHMEGYKYL